MRRKSRRSVCTGGRGDRCTAAQTAKGRERRGEGRAAKVARQAVRFGAVQGDGNVIDGHRRRDAGVCGRCGPGGCSPRRVPGLLATECDEYIGGQFTEGDTARYGGGGEQRWGRRGGWDSGRGRTSQWCSSWWEGWQYRGQGSKRNTAGSGEKRIEESHSRSCTTVVR